MAEVRLQCPSCDSTNSWADYECDPCGGLSSPYNWSEEAFGPTPDGSPHSRPCPAPGCSKTDVPAKSVACRDCDHTWVKGIGREIGRGQCPALPSARLPHVGGVMSGGEAARGNSMPTRNFYRVSRCCQGV